MKNLRTLFLTAVVFLILAFGSAIVPMFAPGIAPAFAETQPSATEEEPPQKIYLYGRFVGTVYLGLGPMSKEVRAEHIEQKLESVANLPDYDPSGFHLTTDDFGVRLFYKETPVFLISNEDAAIIKQTKESMSREGLERIKRVIGQYRAEKQPKRIAVKCGIAFGGLLVLLLATVATFRLFHWLARLILELGVTKASRSSNPVLHLFSQSNLAGVVRFAVLSSGFALILSYVLVYFAQTLSMFPWTRMYGQTLESQVSSNLSALVQSTVAFLPNAFLLVIIAYLTNAIIGMSRSFFNEIRDGNFKMSGFDPDWAEPTYKLVRFLLIVLALTIAYPYTPGWDSPSFKQIGLFLGLLISLGSTGAVGHLVAGIMLTYTRAFKLGDRVKIGDHVGDIISKTLFATTLITVKNEQITLHNGQVMSADIVNYSRNAASGDGLILHTTVTIGYDSSWRTIHELLIAAARDCPGIKPEPQPFVLQRALNDFYVEYEINAYTDRPSQMLQIYSDLHQRIQDRFYDAGVEIMSPHYYSLRDGNDVAMPPELAKQNHLEPTLFNVSVRQAGGPVAGGAESKR